MKRIGQEILKDWAALVSEKVGKTEQELCERGLGAGDFRSSTKVILSIPGELECMFSGAFFVVNEKLGRVAVFTEHSGYHEFYLNGMKVSEVTSVEYWDEDYRGN